MERKEFAPIEETALKVDRLFNAVPLIYKRLIVDYEVLMVLGGIKNAVDIGLHGDLFNEHEFIQFKSAIESAGLIISDVDVRVGPKGETLRQVLIYDPSALSASTESTLLAPHYEIGVPIEEYIDTALKSGYKIGGILGKIYSFPESAIHSFLAQSDIQNINMERIEYNLGGEVYWTYPPVGADVVERETKKKNFFAAIKATSQLQRIFTGLELKRSQQAWQERLPEQIKKKSRRFNSLDLIRKVFQLEGKNWPVKRK